jgi:hypothetical protein
LSPKADSNASPTTRLKGMFATRIRNPKKTRVIWLRATQAKGEGSMASVYGNHAAIVNGIIGSSWIGAAATAPSQSG